MFRGAALGLVAAQFLNPVLVHRRPRRVLGQCGERGRQIAGHRTRKLDVRRHPRSGVREVDDARVAEAPEAEPEVERRPRNDHEVGVPERGRAGA